MSSDKPKKVLSGPWRSVQVAIWIIGIYILWTRNLWWPGVLVLLGISLLYEAIVRRYVPSAYSPERPEELNTAQKMEAPASAVSTLEAPTATTPPDHPAALLPAVCPSCNAPIHGEEVQWTGPESASCPYCGSNLPMNKA